MATSKIKKETIVDILFSNKIQEKTIQINKILPLFLIGTVLTAILSLIKASLYNENLLETFGSVLVVLPILLLILFSFIHLFLSAFSNSKIKFWKSYILFSIVLMVEIVIGNLFNIIQAYFENDKLNYFLGLVISLLLITIVVILTRKLKTYYKASYVQIIASYLLSFLTLTIIGSATYLVMIS